MNSCNFETLHIRRNHESNELKITIANIFFIGNRNFQLIRFMISTAFFKVNLNRNKTCGIQKQCRQSQSVKEGRVWFSRWQLQFSTHSSHDFYASFSHRNKNCGIQKQCKQSQPIRAGVTGGSVCVCVFGSGVIMNCARLVPMGQEKWEEASQLVCTALAPLILYPPSPPPHNPQLPRS